MIYIIRHQEGGYSSNCLSENGERNARQMAAYFKKKEREMPFFQTVYTILPFEYKHMRPMQTACTICTHLNKATSDDQFSVMACTDHEHVAQDIRLVLSSSPWLNVIIVWHHEDMNHLIAALLQQDTTPITWPDDNFNGCVQMDTVTKSVTFVEHLIPRKTMGLFRMLCCHLFD